MENVIDRIDALIKTHGTDLQIVVHPDDVGELGKRFGPHYRPATEHIMATVMGLPVVTSEWIERGTSTIMPRTDIFGNVRSTGPVSIEKALAGFEAYLKNHEAARG